jgi:sarcosine oxidase subunit gamma
MMEPQRLSPLDEILRQHGATMTSERGWVMANSFGGLEEPPRVGLIDESDAGKVLLHGRGGYTAVTALGLDAPVAVGDGHTIEGLAVYRLRPDLLYMSTPPGDEAAILTSLAAVEANERPVVTDVTDGRAQIRLVGPAAAELLGRLCGLDLRDAHFPLGAARQTSVAKTAQLILRHAAPGLPSYSLIGARSLGLFLWQTLWESGQDLGVRPLGRAEWRALSG